jgi:hypothetical protein
MATKAKKKTTHVSPKVGSTVDLGEPESDASASCVRHVEPEQLVDTLGCTTRAEERGQPTHDGTRGCLHRDDDPRMRAPAACELGVEPSKVPTIEADDHSAVGRGELELRFIRRAAPPRLERGQDVEATPPQSRGDSRMDVLVRVQTRPVHALTER